MILCNGAPKTGTNLLQKVCGALGFHDIGHFALVGFTPGKMPQGRGYHDETKYAVDVPILLRRGNDWFIHSHCVPFDAQNNLVLNSVRDPRDSAVSFIRWADRRNKGFNATEADLIKLIRKGPYGKPWAPFAASFKWPYRPNVLEMKFEDICTAHGVHEIATFVGRKPGDPMRIAKHIYGSGKKFKGADMYAARSSWSGEWSDWEDWWSDSVEKAWKQNGGYEAMEILGYAA